jgi:hypothetical protein
MCRICDAAALAVVWLLKETRSCSNTPTLTYPPNLFIPYRHNPLLQSIPDAGHSVSRPNFLPLRAHCLSSKFRILLARLSCAQLFEYVTQRSAALRLLLGQWPLVVRAFCPNHTTPPSVDAIVVRSGFLAGAEHDGGRATYRKRHRIPS